MTGDVTPRSALSYALTGESPYDQAAYVLERLEAIGWTVAPLPKPAEPTGLGAVVEDAEGRVWVRQCCTGSEEQDMSHPWLLLASRDPMPAAKVENNWREIDVVCVLSEVAQP